MTYDEFQSALRQVAQAAVLPGAAGLAVRIGDLRHWLRNRVSHAEFDAYVRRLRSERRVALTAHAHPELLDSMARQDCFVDGPDTFYFLRWLS